jgi:hypothetical protein
MVMETTTIGTSLWRRMLAAFAGQSHGGARDLYAAFGWPAELTFDHFLGMYQRGGIASRIVKAAPKATWRDAPVIRDEKGDSAQKEDKDKKQNKNYSPFVESVEDFFERMRVYHYLERADRLAGIGQYSVLFMGFGDSLPLNKPLSGKAKLLFLQPYMEKSAQVAELENNPNDSRYGLPRTYRIQQQSPAAGGRVMSQALTVHHSRILHVADGCEENDIYGTPKLLSVFNNLMDLQKVSGASAETFWLNSRGATNFSIDKDATIDEAMLKKMREEVDEFQHQMRRMMTTQGVTAQQLNSTIADPKGNFDIQIAQISAAAEIPQRILLGNEQGQLASGQDENNWADRIDERRRNHATPTLLQPFVRKMVETGNLEKPQGEFWVEWPETALSPEKLAAINLQRAQTLSTYANSPAASTIVPEPEFRTDFLGMTPESEYEIEEEDPLNEEDKETRDQFDKRGEDSEGEEDREAA